MSDQLFKKATKEDAKLRMAISGPSGSGKTFTALRLATSAWDKVALLDTENESASKYADYFDFHTLPMEPPYKPTRFVKVIQAAEKEGFDCLIIDSLSHAWKGEGGLLEIVDEIAKKNKSGNSFSAWNEATPLQRKLVSAIIQSDLHLIATMRSKQKHVMEKDDDGRNRVKKKGMSPIQRDGMEYEFDISMEMDMEHNGIIQKTRCIELTDKVIKEPGEELAHVIVDWLKSDDIEADDEKRAGVPTKEPSTNGTHDNGTGEPKKNGQQSEPEEDQGETPEPTKAAREIMEERQVPPADVEGTGKDGRITKGDVQDYIDEREQEVEDELDADHNNAPNDGRGDDAKPESVNMNDVKDEVEHFIDSTPATLTHVRQTMEELGYTRANLEALTSHLANVEAGNANYEEDDGVIQI